jgi:hypothetical protein
LGIEFVTANRKGQDGEVNGAGAKTIEENRRDFLGDGEMNFGKFTGEGCEARSEPIGSDGGNGADNDGAGFRLETLGEFVLGAGEFVEDGTGTRQEGFAQISETNGAAEAIEQAATKFGFELLDLLRERRLRDVAFFRGPGERAGVGDGTEVAELVEFHGEKVISYQ